MLSSTKNLNPHNLLRGCWISLIKRAARTYVVGPALIDALRVQDQLSSRGFATTLGFRNREDDHAQQTADEYCRALVALAQAQPDCYLSLKAAALNFAPELLAQILRQSQPQGIRIHFDSLGPETTDATFALIATTLPQRVPVGCTLPGRWQRSQYDADWAVKRGLIVRVVKGEWAEGITPEPDVHASFLAVIDRLAGRARHVAVGTHDPQLAREAVRRLRAAHTSCELEMLLGYPARAVVRVASEMGVPARFYVAYGDAWPPYQLSHIKQNPRVGWWFVRDLVLGRAWRLPSQSSTPLSRREGQPAVAHWR